MSAGDSEEEGEDLEEHWLDDYVAQPELDQYDADVLDDEEYESMTREQREAAEKFGCSEASCKAWRYGYRQPTINQAKQIIKATDGRLDFESIYGPVSEILVTEA